MNKEQALNLLIQVAHLAQSKGLFNFEESKNVYTAIQMFIENKEVIETKEEEAK